MELVSLLVIGGFIYAVYYNFNVYFKFKEMESRIRGFGRIITEEEVREFTHLVAGARIQNHPRVYNTLRAGFSLINNSDNVSYDLKVDLKNTLLKKSVIINEKVRRNKKEVDKEIRKSGKMGERNVKHQLQFLELEGYKILHNVRIPNPTLTQEIDHLVIGPNGVFHIETKNQKGTGKITIHSNGNWSINKLGRESSMHDPLGQVDRHDTVIKYYLNENFTTIKVSLTGVIVLANESMALEGQENCPIPVKKSEQLTYFIKNHKSDSTLSNEEIEAIYSSLV